MTDDCGQAEVGRMIDEAESKGFWMYCSYQNMWLKPVELRKLQQQGRFCWGPVGWTVRDPHERLSQLLRNAERANQELAEFRSEMGE